MSNTVRPSAPSKHTVVEEGSSFKGTLTSSCPIHVHGRVEGDLQAPSLMVSASGAVHGRVQVGEVRSQGELSGEFDAETIELAGSVRDNTVIRAKSLEVKLSSARGKLQVIFGECELSVGDAPTEKDMVEPASVQAAPEAALPVPMADAPPAVDPAPLEAPAAALAAVEQAAPEASLEEDEDEGEAEIDAIEAEAGAEPGTLGGRKRRRKRKQAEDEAQTTTTGWSQVPSQPPPAN